MPHLAGPARKAMLCLIRGVWNSPSVQQRAAQQHNMVQKPDQQGAAPTGTVI